MQGKLIFRIVQTCILLCGNKKNRLQSLYNMLIDISKQMPHSYYAFLLLLSNYDLRLEYLAL